MNVPRAHWLRAVGDPPHPWTPERRLWWALVCDAVDTVRTAAGHSRHRHLDVAWLRGAPALLPFADLCDGLGLDAEAVRTAALAQCIAVRHKRGQKARRCPR